VRSPTQPETPGTELEKKKPERNLYQQAFWRDSDSGFIVGKVAVCCNSDFSQKVFLDFPDKDSNKNRNGAHCADG